MKLSERVENVKSSLFDLSNEELIQVMGLCRHRMLRNENVTSETHSICPIENKVIRNKYAKKIVTENKRFRYYVSVSWYFMSRKTYNKIMKGFK